MARDAKRAQKAAEKRRQRQRQVRQDKTRRRTETQEQGSGNLVRRVENLPVEECVISKGWRDRGVAHILLARRRGDGQLLVGGFFVDLLCVGLKDCAVIPEVDRDEYANNVKDNIFNDAVEFEPVEPGVARAVVEGAMAFAGELGFRPNRRWTEARKLFGTIAAQPEGLEFGRDGKPCLVLRDGENLRGAQARLQRKLGEGGFQIVDERGDRGAGG